MKNQAINGMIHVFDKILSQLNIIIVKNDAEEAKETLKQIDNENLKETKVNKEIISTEKIEKELKNRNVTREDFLQFYKIGRDTVKEKQRKILQQILLIEEETGQIFLDSKNGENLQEKLASGKLSISKKIVLLEQIRKNATQVERLHDLLEKGSFLEEITTTSQVEGFEKFIRDYDKNIKTTMNRLKTQNIEYQEDIDIFNKEISTISDELETQKLVKNGYKQLEKASEEEKKLRARQIRATIFGDEQLEKEWDERVKRFYSHKSKLEGYTYIHKEQNGDVSVRKIDYETILNYEKLEEDAYFLNLADYKKYLEYITMYDSAEKKYGRGAGLELIKKVVGLEDKEFEEYKNLLEKDSNKADEWIKQYVEDMREYVKTFHGFTNKHAVKAEVWKTAGSTLKKMKKIRGDMPFYTKLANATENVFRFFGIRKPEFYTIERDGTKKLTPGKAALTIIADAGIVAGIATTATLTGPVGVATWGAAYAAKGLVTAANVVRGRIEYKKHKDVIDANLPTLGSYSQEDKEIVRKAYYRKHLEEIKGRKLNGWEMFTTWAHAKSDRLFFRKKAARDIEEKNADEKIKLSDLVIDERTKKVKENAIMNVGIAEQNHKLRQEEAKKTNNTKIAKTKSLSDVSNKGNTVANTVISVEQKYKARQQYQDRVNKIWIMILTAGMKIGVDALRTGFKEQIATQKEIPVEKKEIVSETQTIPGQKKWVKGSTIYNPVIGHKKIKELDVNKKIGELDYSDECASSVYEGYQTFTNNRSNSNDIVAIVLRAKDKNGTTVEVSLAEQGMGLTTNHVHSLTNYDISKLSFKDAIEKLKDADPENYKRYVEAIGLNEKSSAEEIGKIALEQGQFFKQSSKLEGWTEVLPGNIDERVETFVEKIQEVHNPGYWEQMPDVTKIVNVEKTVKTVEKINETKDIFKPIALGNSSLQGVGTGVFLGATDQIHEIAEQDKLASKENFEEGTLNFFTSRMVINQSNKLKKHRQNVERLKRESKERKKQIQKDQKSR